MSCLLFKVNSKLLNCISKPIAMFIHENRQESNQNPYLSRSKRLYGFGVVATGAIGIKELIIPPKQSVLSPKFCLSSPHRLNFFSDKLINVKTISCGFGYSIFITNHPKLKYAVYGCGLNSDGQLGHQTKSVHGSMANDIQVDVVPEPQIINLPAHGHLTPFAVSCGRAHTLIACKSASMGYSSTNSKDVAIFSMGNNIFGQCARQMIEGEIFTSNNAQITNVLLPPELKSIKKIVCGQDHSLILTDEGTVFSAGLSSDGQTGLGTIECVDRFTQVKGSIENLQIEQISSRGDTVLALTRCGRLFAWGNNEYGQIWPIKEEVQVLEPVELPFLDTLPSNFKIGTLKAVASAGSMCGLLDEHGHVLVWGFGCLGLGPITLQSERPQLIPPALFSPALPFSQHRITDLVPGLHHFIARSTTGLLWSWGAPRGGISCLGLGTRATPSKRTPQSLSAAVARRSNPEMEAVKNAQTYPANISMPAEAIEVFCGVDHTIVLSKAFA